MLEMFKWNAETFFLIFKEKNGVEIFFTIQQISIQIFFVKKTLPYYTPEI